MQKKRESRIGKVFRKVINIRYWSDYDRTKAGFLYLKQGFQKLFVPQKAQRADDFEEAVKKMNLTELDLSSRMNSLWRLSILMVVVASLIFVFAVYHLFSGHFSAALLSLVVMSIALVLAFRYHFWYFQIKQRKLGCTIKEWFHNGIMGENK